MPGTSVCPSNLGASASDEIVDQVADPLLALMPVRPLMPYELYLEPFREPRNVYPGDFTQTVPHQASRHQRDEVAAGYDARDNEERGGRRDNVSGVTEGLQGGVDRRRETTA